jgi:hypothetical protein
VNGGRRFRGTACVQELRSRSVPKRDRLRSGP